MEIFKKQWGQNIVIGTPVCRNCFDDCVEKSNIEQLEDETQPPSHNESATKSVTDADSVTTVFSHETHADGPAEEQLITN